jgi:hypothetical protein
MQTTTETGPSERTEDRVDSDLLVQMEDCVRRPRADTSSVEEDNEAGLDLLVEAKPRQGLDLVVESEAAVQGTQTDGVVIPRILQVRWARQSPEEETGWTREFLRENHTALDLILAQTSGPEAKIFDRAEGFVEEHCSKMKHAVQLVRQELGRVAERRKKKYDLRVRPQRFKTGDWVYYYLPRIGKGAKDQIDQDVYWTIVSYTSLECDSVSDTERTENGSASGPCGQDEAIPWRSSQGLDRRSKGRAGGQHPLSGSPTSGDGFQAEASWAT